MKKYFVLLIVILALSAGNSFAAATIAYGDNTADVGGDTLNADAPAAQLISKMSKGVFVTAITSTGGYSLYTAHKQGSKAYGSAHDSTAIFTQAYDDGNATLSTPGEVGAGEFATGWTAL